MATTVNFASVSGVISVTSGSNPPKYFYGAVGQFCQTPDATGYLIFIGGTSFTVSLSELRINGQAPVSLANAATLLSALFQATNSGSGGSGYSAGYPDGTLIYVALLTQSGTNAPVATVLQNTLGGTVVWSRDDVGKYTATLANAFTTDKTYVPPLSYRNQNDAIVSFGLLNGSTTSALKFQNFSFGAVDYVDTIDTFNGSLSIQILVFP